MKGAWAPCQQHQRQERRSLPVGDDGLAGLIIVMQLLKRAGGAPAPLAPLVPAMTEYGGEHGAIRGVATRATTRCHVRSLSRRAESAERATFPSDRGRHRASSSFPLT